MVPFLAIFAAFGVFSLWEALRQRNYLKLGWLCAALLLIFIAFDYGVFPKHKVTYLKYTSLNFRYHLGKAMEYDKKQDYQNAIYEAQTAYNRQS